MIDLQSDQILPLDRARDWLGERLGRAPAPATFKRWLSCGVKGVVLESIAVGGRRYTSHEAIERFVAALSGGKAPTATARRRKQIEAASRKADALFGARGGEG